MCCIWCAFTAYGIKKNLTRNYTTSNKKHMTKECLLVKQQQQQQQNLIKLNKCSVLYFKTTSMVQCIWNGYWMAQIIDKDQIIYESMINTVETESQFFSSPSLTFYIIRITTTHRLISFSMIKTIVLFILIIETTKKKNDLILLWPTHIFTIYVHISVWKLINIFIMYEWFFYKCSWTQKKMRNLNLYKKCIQCMLNAHTKQNWCRAICFVSFFIYKFNVYTNRINTFLFQTINIYVTMYIDNNVLFLLLASIIIIVITYFQL